MPTSAIQIEPSCDLLFIDRPSHGPIVSSFYIGAYDGGGGCYNIHNV